MLETVLYVVVALVAGVLIYAATRPDTFQISRSVTIAAPPDKVFPLINDLRQFNTWNPFAKQDPQSVITYEAVTVGVGGAYSWKGDKSGAGRMAIAESVPPQRIGVKLDFSKPFEAHNRVDFTIEPQGEGSKVTWAMTGPMPYLTKVMTLYFNMDKMVGGSFEEGLASLKVLAEKR